MAEALYRKYRPQVFEDVVGQEPIERTLKNAIRQDKVSHAYLFCGPRGTGKTTTARLLAKALLCETGPTPDPDGTCEDCLLIADGAHPDVYELDAASRTGVENVREEIISRVHFAPTRGRYKVYIIDEVHMLSTAAFNALLKTLEEPPPHVVFVLCTTDPQKVPETIHSRCQRFDFHRISPEAMVSRLGAICMAEDVEFEGEALDLIAQRAEGGLRNALTSLEQIIAFENGKVTLAGAERLLGSIDSNDMAEIVAYIGKRDIASCFRWTAEYVETGSDLAQFVRDMGEHVRNLYVMSLVGDDVQLDVTETARRELANELVWFGPERTARLLGVLGDLMAELKTSSNPRLAFEIALTRMVRPDSDLTLESLAERVEALESGYSAVAHVLPGGPVSAVRAAEAETAPSSFNPSARMDEPVQAAYGLSQDKAPVDAAPARDAFASPAGGHDVASSAPAARASSDGKDVSQVSTAPASKAATLSNPATLQRVWQAVLADVKKRKQAYGVLFMGTKASYDEAKGMVRIEFRAESSFAFNAVQKPDVQNVLEESFAKAVGSPIAFYFEKGAGGGSQQSQAAPAPEPDKAEQPRAAARQQTRQPTYEQPAAADAPYESVPYEQVPYDDVPYDEAPYDGVPYEEIGVASTPAPSFESAPGSMREPASSFVPAAASQNTEPASSTSYTQQPAADADTSPSPTTAGIDSNGAVSEDPAALQAMFQASFGDGVVFSETDEE